MERQFNEGDRVMVKSHRPTEQDDPSKDRGYALVLSSKLDSFGEDVLVAAERIDGRMPEEPFWTDSSILKLDRRAD